MLYSDAAKTLINIISLLGVLSYSDVMLAVAPAATLITFMDILDVASRSYENVLRLLNTNVEMDSGIMLT